MQTVPSYCSPVVKGVRSRRREVRRRIERVQRTGIIFEFEVPFGEYRGRDEISDARNVNRLDQDTSCPTFRPLRHHTSDLSMLH